MLPLEQVKNPSLAAFAAWSFGVSEPRKTRIPWGVSPALPFLLDESILDTALETSRT